MAAHLIRLDYSPVSVTVTCTACGHRQASTPAGARADGDRHLAAAHPDSYRNTVKWRRRQDRLTAG